MSPQSSSAGNNLQPSGSGDPVPPPSRRGPLWALVIAIVVGVIYFMNTTGMGLLLPEQYNVDLTAEATRVAEATAQAAAAPGSADVAPANATPEAAAVAPAAEATEAEATEEVAAEPTAEATAEPTEEPTVEPTAAPTETPAPTATSAPTATPRPQATATPTRAARINGLPTVSLADLPPEAWDTVDLIDQDGPFPFDRDGITFQNREGLLPNEPRGFYREFTVITPGESDRGARRIIAGDDGALYYTDDHYESFSYVVR